MKMRETTLTRILYYSMLMILFGLIYEQIVFIPNFLVSSASKNSNKLFNDFHSFTNPIHYHFLPSIISIILVLLIWIKRDVPKRLKIKLLICMFILLAATYYVVNFVNVNLFFNSKLPQGRSLHGLAIEWSIVNFIRIIVLISGLRNIQIMYIGKSKGILF